MITAIPCWSASSKSCLSASGVAQAEEAAKHFKSPKEISISKEPKTLPNNLRRAEKTLSDALALKVEIKSSAKGDKGKIVLNFDNEEELEKILSYFN